MDQVKRLNRINSLKGRGTLRSIETIDQLKQYLDDPDKEVQEMACRAIVEEVLGSDHKELRLQALQRLRTLLQPQDKGPSAGQIDLHTHDSLSDDAYLTPSSLVLMAYEEGLTTLGIVSHNRHYNDDEAEQAAILLNIGFFKGTEISVCVPLKNGHGETIHINQLYVEEPPPERMHELFKSYVLQYQQDLRLLGYDLQQALEEPEQALILLREKSYDRQTATVWKRFREQYGSRLPLAWEELEAARRGERTNAFTIAVALWRKFGFQLQNGWEQIEGDFSTRVVFRDVAEVYMKLIQPVRNSNEAKSAIQLPNLKTVASRAAQLQRKLILPHPNECSPEALEQTLEDLALVEADGCQYSGLFVGVEYYSHKLKEPLKGQVKKLVERLNRDHPVYRRHPLLLLPGSDYHGCFSHKYPLGLRDNYPNDIESYNRKVLEVLHRPPVIYNREP